MPATTNNYKHLLGIDKLILMLTQDNCIEEIPTHIQFAKPIYEIDKVKLIRDYNIEQGNQFYRLKYSVFVNNVPLGILYSDVIDNSFNESLKFQILNKQLYTPIWLSKLNLFLSAFNLSINNINSLDVFYDTNDNLLSKFQSYYRDELNVHYKSKSQILLNYSNRQNDFESIYVGDKKAKQVNIYDKTKELIQSKKSFIKSLHKSIFDTDNVYRYEIRLKNRVFKTYRTLENIETRNNPKQSERTDYSKQIINDLSLLLNQDFLFSLITKYNCFEFRYKTASNISRCEPIQFLNKLNTVALQPIQTITDKKERCNLLHIKNTIKSLYEQYLLVEVFEIYKAIEKLVVDNDLQDWYSYTGFTILDKHLNYDAMLKTITVDNINLNTNTLKLTSELNAYILTDKLNSLSNNMSIEELNSQTIIEDDFFNF